MKSNLMKKTGWLLFVVAAIGAGISFTFYFKHSAYVTTHVAKGNILETVYGLGKVKSNKRYEVVAGIVSTVTRRYVNEGQNVKKGSPVLEINSEITFKAPFDGTVTMVRLYEGETSVAGASLLRLEDVKDRYIELSLEQESMLRIKPGLKAKISFESIKGKVVSGEVISAYSRDDDFIVQIKADDLESSVLPGMSADVSIEVGEVSNVLTIPLKALQNGSVSVLRDGKWKKIKVDVGSIDGDFAEIKGSDLQVGEEVRLRPGD